MKSFFFFFFFFLFFSFISSSFIIKGSFKVSSNIDKSIPIINNNILYIGALNDKVYAINISTYQIIWSFNTTGPVRYFFLYLFTHLLTYLLTFIYFFFSTLFIYLG